MSDDARQLPLDLPHAPSFASEDFLSATSNRDALNAIALWPQWAGGMLLLLGPQGAGKSHLAAIWAQRARARTVEAAWLTQARVGDLAAGQAILVENADLIGANEAALFHLLNISSGSGADLLLTARRQPDFWGLATPDLVSRLRLAPSVMLQEPDDELTRAVLFKLFNDRQLYVEPSIIAYIAQRIERSLSAARAIVAALDHEALARARPVTRAMAAQLLRALSEEGEAP